MTSAIQTQDLVKRYRGQDRPALDGVTIQVGQGSVCALLGENGAGKTTLIRILTTLTRPDSGSAAVMGHDVASAGGDVRRVIGLVGQYASVDEVLTGRHNLELFGRLNGLTTRAARGRAGQLLERFRLTDVADRAVHGYSGGMRRRLDLATGLLGTPRVLFVDEPTTGLDPQARREVWRDLRDLADEGTTVLLTTQYLEEADALADQVVILRAGRVALAGRAQDLKRVVGEPRVEVREPTLEDVYLHLHRTDQSFPAQEAR